MPKFHHGFGHSLVAVTLLDFKPSFLKLPAQLE